MDPIEAVIAGRLAANLSLDTAHLGLLTSVYFLAFAAVQLPVGNRWIARMAVVSSMMARIELSWHQVDSRGAGGLK
jgi:hypothetical protein